MRSCLPAPVSDSQVAGFHKHVHRTHLEGHILGLQAQT